MSFFDAFAYALAYLPVISALACIDNPLPMPTTVHELRGQSYMRHRASFAGIPDESRRSIDSVALKEAASLVSGAPPVVRIPFGEATVRLVAPSLDALTSTLASGGVVSRPEELTEKLIGSCLARVQQCVLRSQIHFMQERRPVLAGASPEERYRSFDTWIASDEGTNKFIDRFPVSTSDAQRRARDFVREVDEILARFSHDRSELEGLGIDSTSLIQSIDLGQGDTHGGRSVALLTFDDGARLVYKPRSMKSEESYYNLVGRLRQKWPDSSLAAAKVIDQETYGWAQFIDAEPVTQAENAYRAMGELLGMMHTLRANDIHHENIIMHGNTPVPIDLETLLAAAPPNGAADLSPGKLAASQSVSSVGLLPSALSTPGQEASRGVLDIGAVGYTPGQRSPFSTLVLHRPFTDEMHFTLEFLEHTAPALIPDIGVGAQAELIGRGYDAFMRNVLDDRLWFSEQVAELFQDMSVRFVALNTQRYSQVLRLTTHPDLQKKGTDRDLALGRIALFRTSVPDKVISSELRQLQKGDIPRLVFHSDRTHVYDDEGLLISDVLAKSPLENVLNYIENIDEQQVELNRWLIRLSFASKLAESPGTSDFDFHTAAKSGELPGIYSAQDAIRKQLRELHMTAVRGTDGPPTWIGGRSSDTPFQYWIIDELSMDLYSGAAGLAYNLFIGGRQCKDGQSVELASQYFNQVAERFTLGNDDWDAMPRGAHAGIESFLWAAHEFGRATNDHRLIKQVLNLWTRAVDTLDRSSRDIVRGTSGVLLALCSNIADDRTGTFAELASRVARVLMEDVGEALTANAIEYSGFAHGLAGEYAALGRWAGVSGEEAPVRIVSELLERERQFLNPDGSIRLGDRDTVEARGWCHGAPGLLLAKAIVADSLPALMVRLEGDIAELKSRVIEDCFGGNVTLCHGDVGNLWSLSDAAKLTKDEPLAEAVSRASQRYILDVLPREVRIFNRHTITQSLMVGTGGALAFLAKSVDPSVRSPLWFGA